MQIRLLITPILFILPVILNGQPKAWLNHILDYYAKVPKGNPNGTKGTRPLAVVEPDDVAVESIRALRSSLEFSMEEGQHIDAAHHGQVRHRRGVCQFHDITRTNKDWHIYAGCLYPMDAQLPNREILL